MGTDDDFLLALLNSTPIIDGVPSDYLGDAGSARAWLVGVGGLGTDVELSHVLEARAALQGIVRGESSTSVLGPLLRGVSFVPVVDEGITWALCVEPERRLATRALLVWDTLVKRSPGRLRPCANDECRLFLIDRSTANRARWCSMAVCGNRMKARRHYQRIRGVRGAVEPT